MEILIPSKRIYDIDNSKIINNSYDCIEFNTKRNVAKKDQIYNLNISPYAKLEDPNAVGYENKLEYSVSKDSSITDFYSEYREGYDRTEYAFFQIEIETASIYSSGSPRKRTSEAIVDSTSLFSIIDDKKYGEIDSKGVFDFVFQKSYQYDNPASIRDLSDFVDFAFYWFRNNDGIYYSMNIKDTYSVIYVGFPIKRLDPEDIGAGSAGPEDVFLSNVSISFMCDLIEQNDEVIKNKTGDNPWAIENNSIINTSTKIGNSLASEVISNVIYNEYIDGKETAEIKCSIGDYYYKDNSLAVGKSKNGRMLFEIGDIVIPYVASPNGDVPMSTNLDGTAKKFLVTGVGVIGDGALWQNLTMQETNID